MKKFLGISMAALIAVSSFCSCGKKAEDATLTESGNKGNITIRTEGKEPEPVILSEPEKIAAKSFEEIPQLTIVAEISEGEKFSRLTVGHDAPESGIKTRCYVKKSENGEESEYMSDIKDGAESCYIYEISEFTATDVIPDGFGSFAEYYSNLLAEFGIGYDSVYKNAEFLKKEDEVLLGKVCYAYTMTAEKDGAKVTADIAVDKETGIWFSVRNTDGTYIVSLESGTFDALAVPGVTPVRLVKKQMKPEGGMVDKIAIRVDEINYDNPNNAAEITFEVQNDNRFDVKIVSDNFRINGMCLGGSILYAVCPSSEKVNMRVEIPNSVTELCGVDIIDEIAASLKISSVEGRKNSNGGIWYEETDIIRENVDVKLDLIENRDYAAEHKAPEGTEIIGETEIDGLVLKAVSVKEASGGMYVVLYSENETKDTYRTKLTITKVGRSDTEIRDNITSYAETRLYGKMLIPSMYFITGGEKLPEIIIKAEVYKGDNFLDGVLVETVEKAITPEE